jgi:hypothetical protein
MPVEFFHSLRVAAFLHYEAEGYPELPRPGAFRSVEISPEAFVEHHLKSLVEHWHLHLLVV